MKHVLVVVLCVFVLLVRASSALAQHDAIDLRTVVYHASLNVAD